MLKKLFSLFKTKSSTRRRKTNKHKKYKTNKRTKRAYKMRGG